MLRLIIAQPDVSRRDISEKLGMTQTQVGIVVGDVLKRDGRIRHIGTTNVGYWIVDDVFSCLSRKG